MKLKMKKIFFLATFLIPSLTSAQSDSLTYKASSKGNKPEKVVAEKKIETYSITITVTNIRNHNGIIGFKFYDDSTPFPHDTGFRRTVIKKSEIVGDSFTVTYDGFISQYMGIALLDDENSNWKLDMGLFFPKEGHAFSDYYHTAFRRPVYKDFRFLLNGNKKVIMKIKYY